MAVETHDLGKLYEGGVWGIQSVSFTVPRGCIAVLLGPNGAGKTTTVHILSTLLKPTKGIARVLGMDVVADRSRVRKHIALCPQDVHVDPNLTPWEAVVGYLMIRGWSYNDAKSTARYWLEVLELDSVRNIPARRLSGGQVKRIAVAMVLASEAEVMFLDEPTAGLDVDARYRVWKALREASRRGITILLTTHDMREAEIVSDLVIFINKGRTIAMDRPEKLKEGFGYRYRVVVKKPRSMDIDIHGVPSIDLGDRIIVYARSYGEALSIARSIDAETISIETTGLEDVFLHLVGGIHG